jgi:hypothetical protein
MRLRPWLALVGALVGATAAAPAPAKGHISTETFVLPSATEVVTPWGPLLAVGTVSVDVLEPGPRVRAGQHDHAGLLKSGWVRHMTLARDAVVGPLPLRAGTVLDIDVATRATSRSPIACGALDFGAEAYIEPGAGGEAPTVSGQLQATATVDGIPLSGNVTVRAASCTAQSPSLGSGHVARDLLLRGSLALHEGDFLSSWGAHHENLHVNFKAQQRVAGILTREAVYAAADLHLVRLHPDEDATMPSGILLGARTDLYDDSFDLYFHADGAIALGRPMRPQRLGRMVLGDPAQSSLSQPAVAFWPNGNVLCSRVSTGLRIDPRPQSEEHAPLVLFSPSGRPVLYVPDGFDRPRMIVPSGSVNTIRPLPESHPAFTWVFQCDDFVIPSGREGADVEIPRLRDFLAKS